MITWVSMIFSVLAMAGDPSIELQLEKVSNRKTFVDRLEGITSHWLSLPYNSSEPLGEGPNGKYDQDPLWRFDSFNCTTYVETSIAVALSHTTEELESTLQRIRYQSEEISYITRNHFPSLDWIPNLINRNGFVNTTYALAPHDAIKTAEALIDLPAFYRKKKATDLNVSGLSESERLTRLQEFQSEGDALGQRIAKIDYISIDWFISNPDMLAFIPSGTVVSFVRPNWDLTSIIGTHMNVSHQGFIFQRDGETFLRHASPSNGGSVREERFIDYLTPYVNHPSLKGVHFLSRTNK